MADLMFPLIIVLLLYIIVEETEGIWQLMLYTFLFIPIAIIMTDMINANAFDKLFTGVMPYQNNTLGLITLVFWFLPLFTIMKVFFVKYESDKARKEKECEDNGL